MKTSKRKQNANNLLCYWGVKYIACENRAYISMWVILRNYLENNYHARWHVIFQGVFLVLIKTENRKDEIIDKFESVILHKHGQKF